MRGPHNIVRTCCEFALEERGACEVYLGSPAEIAATARAPRTPSPWTAPSSSSWTPSSACPSSSACAPPWTHAELRRQAALLGLDMSRADPPTGSFPARSGRFAALPPASRAARRRGGTAPREREVDLAPRPTGTQGGRPADVEEFSRVMERDFSLLADRYYLSLAGEPRVRVSGQRVTVTFDLAPSD